MYSLYMHITPNGKRYIGITKQKPVKRWLHGKGYQKQSYFFNAILKYGWDNIEHVVLFNNLTKEEAEQKEIELIAKYRTNERKYGYNIENGGHANKVSKQTRKKLSEINKGKHHSPETCQKLVEIQKERWRDKDYRESQIQKRLGQEAWNKGKQTPKEVREKQRQAKLGKYTGEEHWSSKKVINLDTGQIYDSFGLVAKELGIANGSHIVAVCKGKREKAYGYRWAYYKGGDENVSQSYE